jgi:hypothetical protein
MEIQKELVPIEKTVTLVSKKVADLVIKDATTMATASEYRSQLKEYAKAIKEKKAEVLDPLNETLKKFKSWFKPVEDKCEANLTIIDNKMVAYQTAKIAKEKAEEAKIVAKMESGKIDIDKAVDKLATINRVDKKVETDSGSTSFITTQCFEVVDSMMIFVKEIIDHNKAHKDYVIDHEAFNKYFTVNEVAIRSAMKEGIKIPGVKYYTEQRPRNSR